MGKMKSQTVGDILSAIENRCPAGTAEVWDNVGLLAGDPKWRTHGAVVSIDLTERAIEMASRKGYKLIVNHHPCIFPKQKGLSRVVAQGSNASSALVYQALKRGIAVIATHTNFDRCGLEALHTVAQGLGVTAKGRLIDDPVGSVVKLVVFVPNSHLTEVAKSLWDAGAGQIGLYDQCSFRSEGSGTFRGQAGSRPFLGRAGQFVTVAETRLETVFPRGMEKPVLHALRMAHPYQEIAYDLHAVEQTPPGTGMVKGLGYGFWGEFPRARTFSDVAQDVKRIFEVDGFWVTQPPPSRIRRVAFVAGKGSSFLSAAARAGCDLFITGEAGYHTALDGLRRGVAVMELGHLESERFFLSTMKKWLRLDGLTVTELNVPTQKITTRTYT